MNPYSNTPVRFRRRMQTEVVLRGHCTTVKLGFLKTHQVDMSGMQLFFNILAFSTQALNIDSGNLGAVGVTIRLWIG